jgi:8-oxo-dGTP pyrophosphatase MutT (NUDIX family)
MDGRPAHEGDRDCGSIRDMATIGQRLLTRTLQRYWRLTRGLTMGAQALVLDADRRVLLIRPTYKPGWHFPGGGVERNETAALAVRRELEEEAGVIADSEPELFSLYANFRAFPSDHVALFLIEQWRQPRVPEPNREIAEVGFFAREALPPDTVGAVRRRLAEVVDGQPVSLDW